MMENVCIKSWDCKFSICKNKYIKFNFAYTNTINQAHKEDVDFVYVDLIEQNERNNLFDIR